MVTIMLAITEGTMMARIQAHEPVGRNITSRLRQRCVASKASRGALWCLLIAAGATMPAYAADPGGRGTSANTGYYGQFYKSGQTPAASAAVPAQEKAPAAASLRPRRHLAPDANGLLYQPGFHGCAPGASIGFVGGLRSALAPLPPVPQQQRGRYLRLGLSVAETYSDNIKLAADDNAESAWVTQVVPSLDACANSGRIKVSLDYQLQALFYANNSDLNDIYHHVSGATTIEMLPGHLFLSADSSYGQTVIDPSGTFSDTNLLRPGNRTSSWITNISPYWFQRLGPIGQATLRYRYGRAEYGSSDVSDYTLNGVYLTLTNPPANTWWSYQFSVASQRVERDDISSGSGSFTANDDGVTHFDSATLQVGYQLTESLQLLAMGGVENDYHADGSVDRFGSAIWNVGFRWTSPSNALEVRYGERSFGSSYSIEATHHAPTFDLTLAYHEETTAAGLSQLNRGAVGATGGFPGPIAPIRDEGVYVRKRLSATVAFDTTRTQTILQAYDESREFLTSNEADVDVYGADLRVRYQAGVRTSLVPRFRWEHRSSGQDEADVAEAGIGVVYLLSHASQLAVGYSHSWRDADSNADSYDENRVTAQYSIYF